MQDRRRSNRERVYDHVASSGPGGVAVRDLARLLGISDRTAWRIVAELEDDGEIDRFVRGRVRVASDSARSPLWLPSGEAEELWVLLEQEALPAYLSGLDVLAPYAHHFLFEFPHLVVALKGTGQDVAHRFAASGFTVLQDQPSAVGPLARLVILRELSRWTRYPVHAHVAAPELAWLDLYREVRRGAIQLQATELGRLLNQVLRRGGAEKRLRALAREHFKEEIGSILDQQPTAAFAAAVARGAHE
jgi:hypothetical protein